MSSVYLTHLSILLLATPIFNAFIIVNLVKRKDKSRELQLLTGIFAITLVIYIIEAMENTIYPYPPWFTFLRGWEALAIVIVSILHQRFAYSCMVETPQLNKESKIVFYISLVVLPIALLEIIAFQIGSIPEVSGTLTLIVLLGLWTLRVFWRRMRMVEDKQGAGYESIFQVKTEEAQGIRAFLLIFHLILFVDITHILESFQFIPSTTFDIVEASVLLVANLLTVAVALDHLGLQVPLINRITVTAIVLILGAVSGLSLMFGPLIEEAFEAGHDTRIEAEQTYQFTPSNGGYLVENTTHDFDDSFGDPIAGRLITDLPFPILFFDRTYTSISAGPEGMAVLGRPLQRDLYFGSQQPSITPLLTNLSEDYSSRLYLKITPSKIMVTWDGEYPQRPGARSINMDEIANIYQLTIYPDGVFKMSFESLADPTYTVQIEDAGWLMRVDPGTGPRHMPSVFFADLDIPWQSDSQTGFVQDDYILLREALHEDMVPILIFMTILIFVLVGVFTFFFTRNVQRPLTALIGAMQDVDNGNLGREIKPIYQDELGDLTESFSKMVDSLRKNDQLKDEFLANTSHELRTPLNGIIGIAESLLDGIAGEMPPAAVQNIDMIASSGRRLSGLVSDILDFSKLKNQDVDLVPRPFYVSSLADVVLTVFRALVGERPLYLHNDVGDDIVVIADENRVQQILYNLVGNALKFTPEGGVTVTAERHGDWVAIHVEDTGIGIRPEQQKLIFSSFVQGDGSTDRRYQGTGLGLSITKRLVELHNGEISVASEPGQGATFTFTLPAGDPNTVDAAVYTALPSEQAIAAYDPSKADNEPTLPRGQRWSKKMLSAPNDGFRILVVDDEPVNLQVVNNHLTTHNYQVTQALDGEHALHLVHHEPPFDMIILDVMMPRMSGYEVCQRIREDHQLARHQLPIIMLTAKNQTADLLTGFESGANDYLIKPFSKDELLTRIKTHLQLAQTNISYSRFVPSEYLNFLEKESIIDVQLGDHVAKEMAVMFSDIRSFTTISETMSSQENFDFVNAYLRRVSPHIRENEGFIVKYLGDGMMAVFPTGADGALTAGIGKLHAVNNYNTTRKSRGRQPIHIGIGIHVGPMMVGMVGEMNRMQGDAFSDHVNLTARLESLTKTYGVSLVMSEYAYSQLSTPEKYYARFLDRVVVKGRSEPIGLYEILDGLPHADRDKKWQTRQEFASGIKRYQNGELEQARTMFTAVLASNPDDLTAKLYLSRIEQLQTEGLPADWDGVWQLQSK